MVDFGIALALRNAGGTRLTHTGMSIGTPQYMSPEQAAGEREIDGRADIYALGTLLFEMLAGEVPHAGPTAQAVIAKVMTTEARMVTTVRPSVPDRVSAVIHKALSRSPDDRYASADDFVHALAPRTIGETMSPLTTSMPVAPVMSGHSTPTLAGVAIAAAAVGFALGWMLKG